MLVLPRSGFVQLNVQADCRPNGWLLQTPRGRQPLNMALGAGLRCLGGSKLAAETVLHFNLSCSVLFTKQFLRYGILSAAR